MGILSLALWNGKPLKVSLGPMEFSIDALTALSGLCGILRFAMKGSPAVIKALNETLRGELVAINQYFLHAAIYRNWGYERLYKKMYDESIEEMKHAEMLIERILFLEGGPTMSGDMKVVIGRNVQEMLENDLALEKGGLPELRKGIALCLEQEDNGTREVFENLLKGSEKHVQWLESQLTLIRQVGLENYAARQIGE